MVNKGKVDAGKSEARKVSYLHFIFRQQFYNALFNNHLHYEWPQIFD